MCEYQNISFGLLYFIVGKIVFRYIEEY
jgi:hypothetical protein